MTKKTMRVQAVHPRIRVPYPGKESAKLGTVPMTVPRSPYWLRYLDMGIVLEVPPTTKPASAMPVAKAEG